MIGALVAGQVGSGGAVLSSFESIATATGTGSSDTITFSSIPTTFKHLQIRGVFSDSLGYAGLLVRFNSDTGSNYSWHRLYGSPGTSANALATGSATQTSIATGANGGATSTIPGACLLDILDYRSTTNNKTVRFLGGCVNNNVSYQDIFLSSGNWRSTSAITSISLIANFSGNWNTTTSFALYGIKEA